MNNQITIHIMRKLSIVFTVIAASVITVVFMSCGKQEPIPVMRRIQTVKRPTA